MAAITWICWILGSLALGLGVLWFALALFRDRARGRRRCPKCWYDMAGVPGLTCPECGKEFAVERSFVKTRRHRRQAVAAVALMLVGYLGARIPDVISDGLAAVVPAIPLRVVVSMFDGYSDVPSLPAPGVVAAPAGPVSPGIVFIPSSGQLPPPVVATASKTWWERTELNWKELQRASRARKTIRKAIRRARMEPENNYALSDLKSARSNLGGLGVESKIALDAVRALVESGELPEELREIGIQTLIDMGSDVQGAKRSLRRIARSDHKEVGLRLAALEGLVSLRDEPSMYMDAFRELLSTADWWERPYKRTSVKAAQIARQMPAPVGIAELTGAFHAGDCVTRSAIRHTFRTTYSTTAIEVAMKDLLSHENDASIRSGIEGLGHPDRTVRLIAVGELVNLPPIGSKDGEHCLDALEQCEHPVEQRFLIDLIRRQHIQGERASGLLRGWVGVPEAIDLGYAALLAAERTCPDEVVIEIAISALVDPYPHARYLAAWALGRRGGLAVSALPALERALSDEYGSVQKAAAEAIDAINQAVQDPLGQSSVLPRPIGGP